MTDLPYTYTDSDGDVLRVADGGITAYDDGTDGQVAGVHAPTGEDAVEMARAVLAAAGDTGHTVVSDEKWAGLHSTGAQFGAESMRERAAMCAEDDPTADYDIRRQIRALPLLTDDTKPQDEVPRDTDLIQQVRALVKRYGAPWVAYEAARQARR